MIKNKNMRFATMDDFREDGQLILGVEYYERLVAKESVWIHNFTHEETNRDDLKIKIHIKYIAVANIPVIYS